MRPLLVLVLLALVALSVAKPIREEKQERGPALRLKAPSAARLRDLSFRNRKPVPVSKDAKKITPIFGPSIIFSMGTPEQAFLQCNIDTMSGDTWIVDVNADQPEPAPWQFLPGNSSTFKNSNYPYSSDVVDINGLPAKITGTLADDVFDVEGNKFAMRFALIESIQPYLDYAEVPDVFGTGRFGIGFHATDYMDLFLPKLFSHFNNTQRSLTSVLFECMPSDDEEESTGEMTLGWIDSTYCNTSTTVTVPLSDRSNWNFIINGYAIGNITTTTRQSVSVNTKELLTGVPTNVYNYIYQLTNATIDDNYIWPIVQCGQQFPHLRFIVGGETISIPPHLYVFEDFKSENTPCHLMLYPMNGGGFLPSWSFGYIWLYKKCVTFDYGRHQLGFTDYNHGLCSQ